VEANEALDRVLTALVTLSLRDQEVLRLAAFEELTNHEIATVLGIPLALVRSRLFRARRRLQNAFTEMAKPPGDERKDD
jgi:RNA polymerase sigma-70 factor (ECF subfamily)